MLEVKNLKTYFDTSVGTIRAVDGLSFSLESGETLGIVGESGCGKSVTCLSIMRLISTPPGRFAAGEIFFEGQDLFRKSKSEICAIRGGSISMIFQEPMTSLNPVTSIGKQIREAIILHQKTGKAEAKIRTIEMLHRVGISSPEEMANEYPHKLSGGMRQRVMIAMALSCRPKLLIADEPTTALDVTIQAQILDLMNRLRKELGMAIILITHDLGVIAETVKRVIVMYGGLIVEQADIVTLFNDPLHPYTRGLMNSMTRLDDEKDRLSVIMGNVPNPLDFPSGCCFHPRCSESMDVCRSNRPQLLEVKPSHLARCWLKL